MLVEKAVSAHETLVSKVVCKQKQNWCIAVRDKAQSKTGNKYLLNNLIKKLKGRRELL